MAVALGAVVVGIELAGQTTPSSTRRANTTSASVPAFVRGTEFEPSVTDGSTPSWFQPEGIVEPGSVRVVLLPDAPGPVVVYQTAFTEPNDPNQSCVAAPRRTWCGPLGISDISPGAAATDASGAWFPAVWTGLPPEATIVDYTDVDGRAVWQRPIRRVALFPPSPHGRFGYARAMMADGAMALTQDGYVSWAGIRAFWIDVTRLAPGGWEPFRAELEVRLRACLAEAGATFADGPRLPALPPGATTGVWRGCVSTLADRADETAGYLVPPVPTRYVSPTTTTIPGDASG